MMWEDQRWFEGECKGAGTYGKPSLGQFHSQRGESRGVAEEWKQYVRQSLVSV